MTMKGVVVLAATVGTASSTPLVTGAIAAKEGVEYMAIVALGNMAAETIDCSIQSVDSDGTSNAASITALTATQLASDASANDNDQVVFKFNGTALIASGKSHFRVRAVTGGATGGPVGLVVVARPRYSARNAASVVQLIEAP